MNRIGRSDSPDWRRRFVSLESLTYRGLRPQLKRDSQFEIPDS